MRNISFALTTEQVRNQSKTVTRRIGWLFLKRGDLLQPVVKGQGIKKGEKVELIGRPIRVVDVHREELIDGLTLLDVRREGFPAMTTTQFIEMFCRANKCRPTTFVTRIEFDYTAKNVL